MSTERRQWSRMPLQLAFLLIPILAWVPARAAGEASCVSEYQVALAEGRASSFSASDAANKLGQIASVMITSIRNIVIVPCGFFNDRIVAWNHIQDKNDKGDDIESGEYIVYSTDWLRTAIIDTDAQALGLFAHELAHFANRHWQNSASLTFDNEAEADEWAGCALARMKKDTKPFEELLRRIRGDVDSTHPSAEHAIELVRKGYKRCGGALGTRVVYFVRDADGGGVEAALKAAGIDFEVQASDFSEPVDYVTCTKDVPVADLRNVAKALVKGGIRVAAVSINDAPTPRPRITIETHGRIKPFVKSYTLNEIDKMECEDSINERIEPQEIRAKNNCDRGSVRFLVGMRDRSGKLIFKYRTISAGDEETFTTKTYGRTIYERMTWTDPDTGIERYWPASSSDGTILASPEGRLTFRRTAIFSMNYYCD